tara:strand:+ start:1777 stop:2820 length:1044 start_codon:yes stop_codon:yes gene_type:complete
MRIKITEDQYALLNGNIEEEVNLNEEEETIAFEHISIDNKISNKIKSLLPYIPGVKAGDKGLGALTRRLEYLGNPTSEGSLGSRINSLMILTYLEKIRDEDLFEASAAGFFFESFIAGLLNAEREDEPGVAKGAADIIAGGDKFSLKLYSPKTDQIQIKSKTQSADDVTDYAIIGVKSKTHVVIWIKETRGMKPEETVNDASINTCFSTPIYKKEKNDKGKTIEVLVPIEDRKWYITQENITKHADEKIVLDYNKVKEGIDAANDGILCIIKEMNKEMADLKSNVETMLVKSGKEIGKKAEEAKQNAKRLDGLSSGESKCAVDSDKKGLIDKSVDVLTKSAKAQSTT